MQLSVALYWLPYHDPARLLDYDDSLPPVFHSLFGFDLGYRPVVDDRIDSVYHFRVVSDVNHMERGAAYSSRRPRRAGSKKKGGPEETMNVADVSEYL